jgi:hypothetical protein
MARLTLLPSAIIKTAAADNVTAMENLDRECRSYLLPGVASAACFRKMYDVIGYSTDGNAKHIALEWLDTTLAEVEYLPSIRTYALIETCLRVALNSCVVLASQKHVNTGIVSGLEDFTSVDQSRLQTCKYPTFWNRGGPSCRQSRRFGAW